MLYSPAGYKEHKDADWIEHIEGVRVKVTGIEHFPKSDDGYPYILRLESKPLKEHVDKMQAKAREHGVEVSHFEGGYKPHLTVGYGESELKGVHFKSDLEFDTEPSRISSPRGEPLKNQAKVGWRFGEYDYRGQHTAPGPHFGWPITDMEAGAPDFYTHPKYYMYNDPQYDHESLNAILPARNNPESMVTIHRAGITPEINTGDWITPSHSYAKHHALANFRDTEQPKVWSARVPAKHVWWNGDDLNEYGYHGPPIQGQRFYRTQSNPELRPGSEVMTAYSPQEAQVLDQMSLASVAHYDKPKTAGETAAQRLRRAEQIEHRFGPDQSKVVHQFPDGWSMRQLNTYGDAVREGELMGNCFSPFTTDWPHMMWESHPQAEWDGRDPDKARYDGEIPDLSAVSEYHHPMPWPTYSLRDPNNLPHVTADPQDQSGNGILGRHNTDVKTEHYPYLYEWMTQTKDPEAAAYAEDFSPEAAQQALQTKTAEWTPDHQGILDENSGQDLHGLPGPTHVPGTGPLHFHSHGDIQRIADEYNQAHGLPPHL